MNRQDFMRLSRGDLFCDFEWSVDDFSTRRWFQAVVWYEGGAKNGCHQPYTFVHSWSNRSEVKLRIFIERKLPGIVYRQIPEEWL